MKITDYHRELAAKYYGLLLKRFRFETLLRHTGGRISKIMFSENGLDLLEKRVLSCRYTSE